MTQPADKPCLVCPTVDAPEARLRTTDAPAIYDGPSRTGGLTRVVRASGPGGGERREKAGFGMLRRETATC